MNYQEEKKYVGHRDQLMRIKRFRMQEGKAEGVELLDVQNRSGMHFDVNVSRGMDIPYLDFCGENIGFVSPCGIVAPEYFDDKELGFLKSFTAGFLTTCGLKVAGAPCEYEGTFYGLHGNLSHTPAEEVSAVIEENGDSPCAVMKGKVRDAVIFGDKLCLEREIRCSYKERKITLKDRVTNEGFKRVRQMILYHCNIGYPILSPDSEIFIPALETKARNVHAQEGIDSWMKVQEADADYEEMCYYHKLKPDEKNHSVAVVYNPDLDMGIAIEIDLSTLDHFVQWKMMGAGDYVMGLEPSNSIYGGIRRFQTHYIISCSHHFVQWKMMGAGDYVMGLEPSNSTIDGIDDAVKNGSMKYLEPGETREYNLTFHILKGRKEFEELKKRTEIRRQK